MLEKILQVFLKVDLWWKLGLQSYVITVNLNKDFDVSRFTEPKVYDVKVSN